MIYVQENCNAKGSSWNYFYIAESASKPTLFIQARGQSRTQKKKSRVTILLKVLDKN